MLSKKKKVWQLKGSRPRFPHFSVIIFLIYVEFNWALNFHHWFLLPIILMEKYSGYLTVLYFTAATPWCQYGHFLYGSCFHERCVACFFLYFGCIIELCKGGIRFVPTTVECIYIYIYVCVCVVIFCYPSSNLHM